MVTAKSSTAQLVTSDHQITDTNLLQPHEVGFIRNQHTGQTVVRRATKQKKNRSMRAFTG
jgi:hypothetical protein